MTNQSIYKLIKEASLEMKEELLEIRRYLHQHPELSFQEEQTTKFIQEKLKSYGYSDIKIGFDVLTTGLTTYVGKGDRCIMLREDIDALPIEEKTGLPYSSVNSCVMHACGHDAHITTLLGVAKILKKYESQLKGKVKLLFQPAEETRKKVYEKPLSGAGYVVRAGTLDDVDAAFGMHVWGTFEKGVVFIKEGPTMMASARFHMKVIGKGTHGASPHLGHDPITTACQIVNAVQTVVSREVSPLEPRLITVATIHGGTATNVVPQEVEMSGTIRGAKESVVKFMGERFEQVARLVAEANRCKIDFYLLINGPAVENDPLMTEVVRSAAAEAIGKERVKPTEILTASEDFREYSSKIPAALYFMGMSEPEKSIGQPQHDPAFRINDDVLTDCVAVMSSIPFKYFEKAAK